METIRYGDQFDIPVLPQAVAPGVGTCHFLGECGDFDVWRYGTAQPTFHAPVGDRLVTLHAHDLFAVDAAE